MNDGPVDPGAGGGAPGGGGAASGPGGTPGADESLLLVIDRLAELAEDVGLAEIEVEVGGTSVAVRAPSAVAVPSNGTMPAGAGAAGTSGEDVGAVSGTAVRAPLTGIWYAAPAPGAAPYVGVGSEIGIGQVIGLIEAMKLFNEIKTDHAGRVTRVLVESGQLVKARQPLIEVEAL